MDAELLHFLEGMEGRILARMNDQVEGMEGRILARMNDQHEQLLDRTALEGSSTPRAFSSKTPS